MLPSPDSSWKDFRERSGSSCHRLSISLDRFAGPRAQNRWFRPLPSVIAYGQSGTRITSFRQSGISQLPDFKPQSYPNEPPDSTENNLYRRDSRLRGCCIVHHFETEEQKRTHVIKLNLCRRQMTDDYWGKMFRQLCKAKGVAVGGKGGRPKKNENPATVAGLAEEQGVSESTARRRMKAARELEIYGDAIRDAGKRPVKVKTNNWHGKT